MVEGIHYDKPLDLFVFVVLQGPCKVPAPLAKHFLVSPANDVRVAQEAVVSANDSPLRTGDLGDLVEGRFDGELTI